MHWSYRIGRLFGFPIRVHVSLLIFLGFVLLSGGGMRGLVLMVAVFASVVLHELGHALVARSRGLPIVDISLYPFGGMARMAAPPRTTRDEILMAAAGPAVSLGLGLLLGALAWLTRNPTAWLLAEINLLLGAFNLLPALPMDGGRVLRAVLARRRGFYRATALAARVARWLALGLAVAGFVVSWWFFVLAGFLLFTSVMEQAQAQARQFMGDPGYHDVPAGARAHPFSRTGNQSGFRPDGSQWEILDQDAPGPRENNGRRVYRDRNGNHIVIEWRGGP